MNNKYNEKALEFLKNNKIYIDNLIRKYSLTQEDFEDLKQEAYLAIVKGLEKYNPLKSKKPQNYIRKVIYGEVIRYKNRKLGLVIVTGTAANKIKKLKNPENLTNEQIEEYSKIKEMTKYKFDSPFEPESGDNIIEEGIDNSYQDQDKEIDNRELKKVLNKCMDYLTPWQQEVVKCRYNFTDESADKWDKVKTLRELSEQYNCTFQAVSSVEINALKALKKRLKGIYNITNIGDFLYD